MSLTIIAGAAFATTFGLLVERWWRHRREAELRLRARAWIRRLKAEDKAKRVQEERAREWQKRHEEMSKKDKKKTEVQRRAHEEEIRKYWQKQMEKDKKKDKKKQKEEKKKRKKEEKKEKKQAWKEFKKEWKAKREQEESSSNLAPAHDWYNYGHQVAGHWVSEQPVAERKHHEEKEGKRPQEEEERKSERLMKLLRDSSLGQDLDEDTIRDLIREEKAERKSPKKEQHPHQEHQQQHQQHQQHPVETSTSKKKQTKAIQEESPKTEEEVEEEIEEEPEVMKKKPIARRQPQRSWSNLASKLASNKQSFLDWTEPTTFLIVLCVALAVAFSASAPASTKTGYSPRPGGPFANATPSSTSPNSFLRGISLLRALSAWDTDIESLKANNPEEQPIRPDTTASTTPVMSEDFYQFTIKLLADENSKDSCKCDSDSKSFVVPSFLEVRNWLQSVNNTEVRW